MGLSVKHIVPLLLLLLILVLLQQHPTEGSHFRGAIIMVRPVDSPDSPYMMEISFQISWRRNSAQGGYCDDDTIQQKSLIGSGNLDCSAGCSGRVSDMHYMCTDYSIDENWSYGERSLEYDFAASASSDFIKIAFSGSAWISPFSSSWYIPTKFSLIRRNDTGRINSSPRAKTAPVIRLQHGCNHTINLAVSDPDDDGVRCRWAVSGECGGICNKFPGAILDPNTCTFKYSASLTSTGYKAAAIMLEDFLPGETTPLSSVALQFLIYVFTSDSLCSRKPEPVYPTLLHGACVAIPKGNSFESQIIMASGGDGVTVTEIQTVSPAGMIKKSLESTQEPGVSFVNITWTPTDQQQDQIHQMCYTGSNSAGLSSEQVCIKFMVGFEPPQISVHSPNADSVHPSETTWSVTFDRNIKLSMIQGLVQFHEYDTNKIVHSIDASLSPEVEVSSLRILEITPDFTFEEKKRFYITIGRGVINGMEGCGPGNEPVTDKNFWTFTTLDVTPPNLWFRHAPSYTNENVTLDWISNEVITEECFLVSDDSTEEVNCNNQHTWSITGLKEGTYQFIIDAKDEAENAARLTHTFSVDKTPPVVTITTAPDQFTKSLTTTIFFNCNKPGPCSFQCMFYDVSKQSEDMVTCNSGSFRTPLMQPDSEYLFGVQATDSVGNVGDLMRTTWIVDQEAPAILDLADINADCTGNLDPDITGRPNVQDNRDSSPVLSYRDQFYECYLMRIWTAQDKAGNMAQETQNISLTFQLVINALPIVSFSCDSAKSATVDIPTSTASASNQCGRLLEMTYSDSQSELSCPVRFTRTWTVKDICTQKTQTISQEVVVNDVCPEHACGRNFSDPHGVCTFGECSCIQPWYGTQYELLIYEPKVQVVDNFTIEEGEDYNFEPQLIEGTPPLTWTLNSGPEGMRIDVRSGEIKWSHSVAGRHVIKVKVQNQVGKFELMWILQVQATYTALLTNVDDNEGAYLISGKTDFQSGSIINNILDGIVPVNIDITSPSSSRTISVLTKPDGTFATFFYPAPGEYGTFTALARHPSEISGSNPIHWKILGMNVLPKVVSLTGESTGPFRKRFINVATLINDGPGDLNDVRALGTLTSHLRVNVLLEDDKDTFDVFKINDQSNITLEIETTRPLSATFSILLSASSGVKIHLTVHLKIVHILPEFQIEPSALNARVIRAESRVFYFNVTNIGKVEATSVSVNIPENDFISLVGFGSNTQIGNSLTVLPEQSLSLEVLVTIPEKQPLGEINGRMTVYGKETAKSIPFNLLVSSKITVVLTITVEDEYTYFAEGKPLVDDAVVRLDNYQRNIHISQTTAQGNGKTTFENIPEDHYELRIAAPSHQDKKLVIIAESNIPEITVFLERTGVNYQFAVTPVQIEDTYQITLEADFETQVPMPVVTITPTEVDLTDFELGYEDTIQYNVTNHGLVRAENVLFNPPTGHPFLEFTTNITELGSLEAQTSIIVPVKVIPKARQKRAWIWVAYGFKVAYSFLCGEWQWRNAIGVVKRREWKPDSEPRPKVNWPGGGGSCLLCGIYTKGYSASTFDFCNPCMQAIVSCIPAPSKVPGLDCIPLLASGNFPKPTLSTSNIINTASWLNCIPSNPVASVLICGAGLIDGCLGSGSSSRRKKRALKDNVHDLAEALYPVILSKELAVEILGSEKWIEVGDPNWYSSVLTPILDDASEDGVLVSVGEMNHVQNTPPPDGATIEETIKMVQRLNTTLASWNSGHLEPNGAENMASFSKYESLLTNITIYNDKARDKGFSSYLDAYSFAAAEIKKASSWEDEEGVCAVVRIRIEQEAALTREGFLAKLDIENKETSDLNNIELEIIIKDGSSGEVATSKFSIGDASLMGDLTGVDGNGVLPSNRDGTAEWLIIPYSEAAPEADKLYDVGGNLYYNIDGEKISINLLPTTINVKPDPSLLIHYFWDKYVISDDPFTTEKEPAIPFTLGVAVKNAGYGTAYNMHITSAQPEIISNEKGLKVSFQIVSSQVGKEQISPSLNVNFGDIGPNETSVARWWLVSSLQGEFKNYSASFENTNPLGDPKLSLLDEVKIHQLIRNVRFYHIEEDDGISDFLTNEWKDLHSYPDTLYSSNSLTPHNVTLGLISSSKVQYGKDGAISLAIETFANVSGLTYFRSQDLKHGLSSLGSLLQTSLAATRIQDNVQIPMENAWLTVSQKKDKSVYLHILDILPSDGTFNYDVELCTEDCPLRNITEAVGLPPKVMDIGTIYAIKENFTIPEELTTPDLVFTSSTTTLPTPKPTLTSSATNLAVLFYNIIILIVCIIVQI